jgi:hypothetical protein
VAYGLVKLGQGSKGVWCRVRISFLVESVMLGIYDFVATPEKICSRK